MRELLHQLYISCATLAVLVRLCAVMQLKGHFGCCICCCIPSKAMAEQKAIVQLWQQRCSCGSNCESCYGAGYVQFPPTVKAKGVTYMVLIGGGLHCKQSSCCSACRTAALCRSHRLLGLQPILYVHPRFAVKIDASQCECIKLHHRTGAYYCTGRLFSIERCCSSSCI